MYFHLAELKHQDLHVFFSESESLAKTSILTLEKFGFSLSLYLAWYYFISKEFNNSQFFKKKNFREISRFLLNSKQMGRRSFLIWGIKIMKIHNNLEI